MNWFDETPQDRRELARERLLLEATERIAEAMEHRGVSQAELASRLGVSASEISMRMRGNRNLTLRTLADMLDALGYDAELTPRDRRTERQWSGHRRYGAPAQRYTASGNPLRSVYEAS